MAFSQRRSQQLPAVHHRAPSERGYGLVSPGKQSSWVGRRETGDGEGTPPDKRARKEQVRLLQVLLVSKLRQSRLPKGGQLCEQPGARGPGSNPCSACTCRGFQGRVGGDFLSYRSSRNLLIKIFRCQQRKCPMYRRSSQLFGEEVGPRE